MNKLLTAKAEATIGAPVSKVWDALINPEIIKQYMFGSTVVSSWQEGGPIIWKGDWQGKPYEDKGEIVKIEPERLLVITHYSPLSGDADVPESYHTLSYELTSEGNSTKLTLTQDNNASEEEKNHNEKNWKMVLDVLKKLLEN